MKTKYVALAVIAAGLIPGRDQEVAAGTELEIEQSVGEQLVKDGLLKVADDKSQAPASKERLLKVRVLAVCEAGQPDDVVELPSGVAKRLEADGAVDSNKEAVAYAATLPQNQPKPKAKA